MSQHDMNIANQGFPAFRADLNNALAALVSNSSGATEPTTMFAHQMWVDTAANPSVLKIRNADNDAWITIGTINQTGDTFTLTSAVSATTLNTSGAVVFNDAGADVDFRVEGDTDANLLFVDAGNDRVGFGIDSPQEKVTISTTGTTQDAVLQLLGTNSSGNQSSGVKLRAIGGSTTSGIGVLAIETRRSTLAYEEAMRIDSSGKVIVNATSEGATEDSVFTIKSDGTSGKFRVLALETYTTADIIVQTFRNPNGQVGSISTSGSSTSYNTSSDYRLKDNIAPMTGALAKVLELNPVTYTWKVDGSTGEGFIAHELQAVCPDAVTGEKDGEEMQGVDYGKITPLLTAALQEAIAEIQSLKARVAELEAK